MKLDVAILGGGIAGNLLARQLRLAEPGLQIGLFERASEPSFKVGESSVEIAGAYLVRRLGLGRYLYDEHLPKNGLRYFFDTPERDAEIADMSEMGTVSLPFHAAFQLDRARLERDLLRMNAESGIGVETGTRVGNVRPGEAGAPHRFETRQGSIRREVEARWLVDATGRTGLVAQQLGLRVPEASHHMTSVWGRFQDVADIDSLGPPAWRARVRYTARGLSTLHFCYPGYWVWFIPLRNGVTSVGVTGSREQLPPLIRRSGSLRGFLEGHRGIAAMLAGAKQLDEGQYAQIAYATKRFFSADRWALVGEAAASQDPLYSPGIDMISLANDFVTDLVQRDLGGEAPEALAPRIALQDQFMRFRNEAVMRLYRQLYGVLGSFELMRLKWNLDLPSYYNLWVTPVLLGRHLETAFLREQLRLQPMLLQALDNFSGLLRAAEAALRKRGDYFRANTGEFYDSIAPIADLAFDVGLERSRRAILKRQQTTFNQAFAEGLDLVEGRSGARPPVPLAAFFSPRLLEACSPASS